MNGKIGQPRWLSSLVPPSAQGVILETQDQVPRWVPCMEPASPSASACVSVSFSVSFMNKSIKSFKKWKGILCYWTARITIIKMSILPKTIYRSMQSLLRFQWLFFFLAKVEKKTLKFI